MSLCRRKVALAFVLALVSCALFDTAAAATPQAHPTSRRGANCEHKPRRAAAGHSKGGRRTPTHRRSCLARRHRKTKRHHKRKRRLASNSTPASPAPAPISTPAAAVPSGPLPFLHQSGTQIVDSSGNAVALRGVNLGGWLSWEGWIFGGGYTGQSAILNRLASLVGPAAAQQFESDVQSTMIQEQDIAEIAQLGFNVIRVPFNYTLLEDPSQPGVYKPSGWAILDNLVSWAAQNHVYIVLDMHAAPGGQSYGFIDDDPAYPLIWGSPQSQSDMINLWQAIAARYHDQSAIAGYDLLNEPSPPNDQALAALYTRTIAAIRSVDQQHMIFLEGTQNSTDFSWATQPLDSNMVYSPHLYLWSQSDPAQQLAEYAQMAAAQNVPLWIGEFGENSPSADQSQVASFDAQSTVAGWAYWTWKQAGGLGAYSIPTSADWTSLITWLCGSSAPQPTVAQATQGMQDFVSALQIGNETQDPGVLTALSPLG